MRDHTQNPPIGQPRAWSPPGRGGGPSQSVFCRASSASRPERPTWGRGSDRAGVADVEKRVDRRCRRGRHLRIGLVVRSLRRLTQISGGRLVGSALADLRPSGPQWRTLRGCPFPDPHPLLMIIVAAHLWILMLPPPRTPWAVCLGVGGPFSVSSTTPSQISILKVSFVPGSPLSVAVTLNV